MRGIPKIVLKLLLRQNYSLYTEACTNLIFPNWVSGGKNLISKFAINEYLMILSIFMKVTGHDKGPVRGVAKTCLICPKIKDSKTSKKLLCYSNL